MNLIGGTNVLSDQLTFVEYLYKDLQWANDAEAQVMAEDEESSFALPGSHTGSHAHSVH